MRHRNTEDQALTLHQIASEIYPDIVEKQIETYHSYSKLLPEEDIRALLQPILDNMIRGKIRHLRNLMKEIRNTDDQFRWLCVLPPVRTNKVDSSGHRIRPYVEYRYLNIIASKTPELLATRNEYWVKRRTAMIEGLKKAMEHEKKL